MKIDGYEIEIITAPCFIRPVKAWLKDNDGWFVRNLTTEEMDLIEEQRRSTSLSSEDIERLNADGRLAFLITKP